MEPHVHEKRSSGGVRAGRRKEPEVFALTWILSLSGGMLWAWLSDFDPSDRPEAFLSVLSGSSLLFAVLMSWAYRRVRTAFRWAIQEEVRRQMADE